MNPLEILQKQFGYKSFRLQQEQIIHAVLGRNDTFVLMPTGGGKSLCYQIPALLSSGLTLVISPLIALMKDQVDSLRSNGVEAACINSTQTYDEQERILQRAANGTLKLLYLAPEKLSSNGGDFLKRVAQFRVALIAVDEAHCISQWGHDFRPEYLMLSKLNYALKDVPLIALTATADEITRKDIIEKLALRKPKVFVSSFNRPNIHYAVASKENSFEKLLEFLSRYKDKCGIIYCRSRNSTEALAERLSTQGFKALPYHAGMEREQRTQHQDRFAKDEINIIVATIAFGMGIDKSNVRFVVHMDLPKNIESYYQETGRAGRDGLASEALLFYSFGDVARMKSLVRVEGNTQQTEIALKKLQEMARFAEQRTCRRKYLLNYFNETYADRCENCDICQRNANTAIPEIVSDERLLRQLRQLRKQMAADANVPAYIIFSDATLAELATYRPVDPRHLRNISGIGEVKAAKYGPLLIREIRAYCEAHGVSSRMDQKSTKKNTDRDNATRQHTLSLFNAGHTISEIASMRGLAESTIHGHLAYYVQKKKIGVNRVIEEDKIPAIRSALEFHGSTALAPVKAALGERFTYAEIRYVLADMISKEPELQLLAA
ncbi:MAG TPA: RecQ family ATP-dependent DNA helicase [Chryseosolibacter sp.]|nr:RecQ family ATP-dependent DNA helicase [Chryseosolibacter sp.]